MSTHDEAVTLRPARDEDAQAIAKIWYEGWCDGHLGHVPDDLVAVRTRASFESRASQRVSDTVVAVVDGTVAGFVMVVDDEVEQVYVSRQHRGTGVATTLLAEAERLVAASGLQWAWLAVVAGNARARRFYQRNGWTDEGPLDYRAVSAQGLIAVPSHRYVKRVAERDVAQAWTGWLDVLESHGFAARAMTRPGASSEDLDRIGEVAGIALPEEMLALYRLSDGQQDPWPPRRINGGGFTTDLFPMCTFLPVGHAAKQWRLWKDIYEQSGPSGMADFAESVVVPEPEKVAKEYWIPGWWPLALDGGGNLLAVDTAPLAGGEVGQIIVMGPDEDVRKVFAPGIVDYLEALSSCTPEVHQEDDRVYWDAPALR